MKVLLINKYFYLKGGAETVFFKTISLLRSKGHEVIPVSTRNEKNLPGENPYFITYPEFRDIRFREKVRHINSFFFNREASKKIEEAILKEKPDIAHIHLMFSSFSVSILPIFKKYNIPVVITVHDYRLVCPASALLNGKSQICTQCRNGRYYRCLINNCGKSGYIESLLFTAEMYFRKFFYPIGRYIDKFIFVSHASYRLYTELNPKFKKYAHQIIYNPIERDDDLDQPYRGKYILYFGRLSEEKGIKTLMHVAERLQNIQIKLAGTGDFPLHDIPKNVELLGFKSGKDLKKVILESTYVIVPSEWYEPFGLCAAEAMALGKPVIASNIGGLPEIVEDRINGYLFDYGNAESLYQTIQTALNIDDPTYYRMCENAYNSIQKFSEERYINNIIELYKTTISEKEKSD